MNLVAIAGSRVPSTTANSIQVMKACQAMAQLGHDVTLLVPAEGRVSPEEMTWDSLAALYGLETPFAVTRLPAPNRRLFTLLAVLRARALRADLLYIWMLQSAAFGLLARLPVILEMHEPPLGRFGPWWYRLFLRLPGRKRLAVITRALKDILERDYGPADDVVLAPNGVDLTRFASLPDPDSARRQIGLPSAPTVVCTGHLYAGRGADLFLALAERIPGARFVWVGGRPEDVEAWRARATSRGLHNVTFTGFVPNRDLPLYQAAADILLMPYGRRIAGSGGGDSASVASPMKMFEYMAAGRAILTSDLPVIREVLNERNAVFCPPEDVDAWQAALESLLADVSRREALGRRARQDVEQYTWLARARRILASFP